MKKIYQKPVRRALAVLATSLVLGGMFAATASASVYQMQSNSPAGTAAPYSAGGGVPAASLQTSVTTSGGNFTVNWYGVQGWYQIQATTNVLDTNSWTTIATVSSSDFSGSYTGPKPDLINSYSFRLALVNNYYAGADQCSSCHSDKYNGWKTTPHSYAIKEHVNPDGSLKTGSQLYCINCHSVGDNLPTGYAFNTNGGVANYTSPMASVGCETCHGPAAWHKNSEHDVIRPVVSVDPSICGSCHQGATHPTFAEYTNTIVTLFSNKVPAGIILTAASSYQVSHYTGGHNSFGCAFCHNAVNRQVMISEYYDKLAGNPHPVSILTSGVPTWTATCVTCHDPHASNYVAQLRYPTYSTNYYCMPTVTDTRTVIVTNYNGTFTTNTVNMNTVFDAVYDPKVQVCAQCHSGGRGMRWDGTAYGLVTNLVPVGLVTNTVYYDLTTTVTNTQVSTNSLTGVIYTNTYIYTYVSGRGMSNQVVNVTNSVIGVGVVTPLIAYTNGTVQYTTNSSGFSVPHYPVQYNILIGQADFDYATNAGVASKTHSHTKAPDQCANCHVPDKYATGAHSNTTGHSFARDNHGCTISGCHSSYSSAALDAKVLNLKVTTTNSMARVVSLLNQWATNVAPDVLRTNYAQLAWEFPSPGAFGTKSTNNGVKYTVGPPSKWNGNGGFPSGTNDNLQLNAVPQDIRIARFSLYVIYEDQSLGVHNPSYVSALLTDAETRVLNQFTTSNYPASFAAKTLTGFAPLSVAFTNYGPASSYSWDFGDGGTTTGANPTYIYNTPGLYSVTCTADGKPLTRTQYISVQAPPTVAFTADSTTITNGQTVTFANTSSNTGDVYRYRWYPAYITGTADRDQPFRYDLTPGEVFSYTYTNVGPTNLNVKLTAYTPNSSVSVTNNAFITVTAP